MSKKFSSIACNLDADILQTAMPLFGAAEVEAIEWSFDTLYKHKNIPDWFTELLSAFGEENRLIGHGVFFSLFSGKWSAAQDAWLNHLEKVCSNFQFDHISEHFGFMTGENFHAGAPIGIPYTEATLALGRDRLKRIYQACQCPVGLENLAFAYSLDEVEEHGEFLEQLLDPVNGFIILDLHNLYCQIHNFEIAFEDIIQLYPLDRVREIHISGGSWEDSTSQPEKKIRRDTHDDRVPEEVFRLLSLALKQCPNLKYVVLEQLGIGLHTSESKTGFQEDFYKMKAIVQRTDLSNSKHHPNHFIPSASFQLEDPVENLNLHRQQLQLSSILETAPSHIAAKEQLTQSSLANTAWKIEQGEPKMLETAMRIAQKWKAGFN